MQMRRATSQADEVMADSDDQYIHRLPDGNLYAEVPDDQSCPACGETYPTTKEGVDDHATHHLAEYERLFVWPEFVLEDLLDAEYLSE